MIKSIFVSFLLVIIVTVYLPVQAQNDTTGNIAAPLLKHQHLRISLITCSQGEESYETFGHSGLRVIDSTKTGTGRDLIYNYGTVDFFDGSYLYKFVKGNITTFLEAAPYPLFIKIYADENRGITEQVLILDDRQKDNVVTYLENNALTENRYSKFDVIYNNCTTQTRDALMKSLGNNLILGQVVPKDKPHSFRDGTDEYLNRRYWSKVVLNIFFAEIDKTTSNSEAMFLPSTLSAGLDNATINGHKLCSDKIRIAEDRLQKSNVNGAFITILVIALITITSLSIKRLSVLGKFFSTFVLCLTGILGWFILYAWYYSHPECRNNYNILWALPTNFFIPFLGPKIKAKYAPIAISLLGIFIIFDLLRIQVMPLFEISPLFLTLLYIYYLMIRNGRTKSPLPQ